MSRRKKGNEKEGFLKEALASDHFNSQNVNGGSLRLVGGPVNGVMFLLSARFLGVV